MKDPNMGRCSWIIQVGSVSSKILIRGKQRVIRRDVKTEAEGREQDLKICRPGKLGGLLCLAHSRRKRM